MWLPSKSRDRRGVVRQSGSRVLDEELVVDTTATVATVLQDELENTYSLPR